MEHYWYSTSISLLVILVLRRGIARLQGELSKLVSCTSFSYFKVFLDMLSEAGWFPRDNIPCLGIETRNFAWT